MLAGGRASSGKDPNSKERILVLSNDAVMRDLVAVILKQNRFAVLEASGCSEAKAFISSGRVAALVVDVRNVAPEGRWFVESTGVERPKVPLLLIGDEGDREYLAGVAKAGVVVDRPFEGNAIAEELLSRGVRREA